MSAPTNEKVGRLTEYEVATALMAFRHTMLAMSAGVLTDKSWPRARRLALGRIDRKLRTSDVILFDRNSRRSER